MSNNDTPNVTYREDGVLLVRNVRLSYPHLFEPWSQNDFDDNGKPVKKKYSASLILPVSSHREDIIQLKKYIESLAVQSFKQKLSPERYCLRDGNLNGKEEYAKAWYISASQSSDRRVNTVDRNPKREITEESNRLYAGCWVNVLVRPWAQNNTQGGKRINMNLLTVQFVKDDEAFGEGSGPAPADALSDISDDFPDEVDTEGLNSGEGDGLGLGDSPDDDIGF